MKHVKDSSSTLHNNKFNYNAIFQVGDINSIERLISPKIYDILESLVYLFYETDVITIYLNDRRLPLKIPLKVSHKIDCHFT